MEHFLLLVPGPLPGCIFMRHIILALFTVYLCCRTVGPYFSNTPLFFGGLVTWSQFRGSSYQFCQNVFFFHYLLLYGAGILELWPGWEAGCWGAHVSHQSEWNPTLPCRGQGGWGEIQVQGKQLFSPQLSIKSNGSKELIVTIGIDPSINRKLVPSYRKEIHVFFLLI
jgi:hypothetical protein